MNGQRESSTTDNFDRTFVPFVFIYTWLTCSFGTFVEDSVSLRDPVDAKCL